ncbi:MAG TPA: hypothetical protein VJC08_03825 [bacterium]|nr:hypothetical protein [bacterium]
MSDSSKGFILAAMLLAALLTPAIAEAKITVQPDFLGTLLVTFPDGSVQMIDVGEPIPDIPPGSSVEIFAGKMSISTDPGDSLKLSCLGSEASVGGGSSVSFGCGESEGALSVTKGAVQVTQTDGSEKSITDGQEYVIKSQEGTGQASPPTAEGDSLGTPVGEVNPPDSRSMEVSPSQ